MPAIDTHVEEEVFAKKASLGALEGLVKPAALSNIFTPHSQCLAAAVECRAAARHEIIHLCLDM